MGDMFAVGGCDCSCGGCNCTFCVTGGANQLGTPQPLSGALVQIYTDSGMGTLVGSCTTDSTGCCALNVGSTGTYWEVITATGFNVWKGSISCNSCGGTQTPSPIPIGTPNGGGGGGTGGGPAPGYGPVDCPYTDTIITVSIPVISLTGTMTYNSGSGEWISNCMGPDSHSIWYKFFYLPVPVAIAPGLDVNVALNFYYASGCSFIQGSQDNLIGNSCYPFHAQWAGIIIDGTIPIGSAHFDGA